MTRTILALAGVLMLAACGSAKPLRPPPGEHLPIAPYGARATPTPQQLLAPTPQQRPQRSDETLRANEQRRGDEFDLPPQ